VAVLALAAPAGQAGSVDPPVPPAGPSNITFTVGNKATRQENFPGYHVHFEWTTGCTDGGPVSIGVYLNPDERAHRLSYVFRATDASSHDEIIHFGSVLQPVLEWSCNRQAGEATSSRRQQVPFFVDDRSGGLYILRKPANRCSVRANYLPVGTTIRTFHLAAVAPLVLHVAGAGLSIAKSYPSENALDEAFRGGNPHLDLKPKTTGTISIWLIDTSTGQRSANTIKLRVVSRRTAHRHPYKPRGNICKPV
jgi:hypothetical protein